MNREELRAMKTDDLRKLGTKCGIKNSKRYRKTELIEAILTAENPEAQSNTKEAEVKMKIVDRKDTEEAATGKNENDVADVMFVEIDMEKKMPYIEQAEIGSVVAFKAPSTGVLKSAKIINRSPENRKLKLETAYKKRFVVGYDDIVWVRAGSRWPAGILRALKGGARYVDADQ